MDVALQVYDRTKDGTDQQFQNLKLSDFAGKWVCLYFYPLDFTFVCPTEIAAFNKALGEFKDRETVVLAGSSIDPDFRVASGPTRVVVGLSGSHGMLA